MTGKYDPAVKIVVVDDEPQIVRQVAELLQQEGFSLLPASTGQEALALVASEEPWLLILGESLPDGDGREVVRHLIGVRCPRLLILCRPSQRHEGDFGWPRGVVDMFLTKPFHPRELVSLVHRLHAHYPPTPAPDTRAA